MNKITKRSWQRLGKEILPTKDTQKQGEDFKESKSVDPPPYEESNISLWVESLHMRAKTHTLASNFVPILDDKWFIFAKQDKKKVFYAKL